MLIARLRDRGLPVPDELERFAAEYAGVEGRRRLWRALSSEFRPGSRSLHLTQCLALAFYPQART